MIAPTTHSVRGRVNGHDASTGRSPGQRSVRCAIYTRVSTDEQAALEYNSLQTQEEICKTYIAVRANDPAAERRWAYSGTYSDAGYSGGTLDRPELRRLLRDVEADLVDTVVAYKIDRLSRSIGQFYQVWHVLERHGVDFASATQDFNTGTSQGKLMLNMLLSFAQYERELVSERTRDKVHAARRKGKWTGGHPPLGLDLDPRQGRLVVNRDEAEIVRAIFGLYLERLSLTRTVEELDRRCWTRKRWITKEGREYGGELFDTVTLYRLLTNPVYVGKVKLKERVFDGEHEAIVDEGTWDRVQAHLRHNGATGGKEPRNKHHALLRGILRCRACGSAMTHSFTTKKNGVRYRYYRCVTSEKRGAFACPTGSVSAHEIERQVVDRIRAIGRDPELIAETTRQARAQLDGRRKLLEAERRRLAKDLGRQKTALKRLGNGDLASHVTEVEGRIRTIEYRLSAIGQETAVAKGQEIDDRDVARALESFGPLWASLWPTERSRILGLLVEGVDYDGMDGALAVRLRRDWVVS